MSREAQDSFIKGIITLLLDDQYPAHSNINVAVKALEAALNSPEPDELTELRQRVQEYYDAINRIPTDSYEAWVKSRERKETYESMLTAANINRG